MSELGHMLTATKPDDAYRSPMPDTARMRQAQPGDELSEAGLGVPIARFLPPAEPESNDQSQGLSAGEKLYVYGGIVIAFVGFCSGVLWLCGVGR